MSKTKTTAAERKYTVFISAEYYGEKGHEAEVRFNVTDKEVARTLYEHDIEYDDPEHISKALRDLKKRDDVFMDYYPTLFVVTYNGVNSRGEA